ncbi:MAG: GGDEF domain-containing protein [Lachnospiraceae bacterium]|nr:GGDEF domain-containing protein [Lachnospiraceae bacterium]
MLGPTLISIFILLFIIFLARNNAIMPCGIKKAFIFTAITILTIVVSDQIGVSVEGTGGVTAYLLCYFGNTMSKMLSPLPPVVFNYYSEKDFFVKKKKLLIPIALYEVLCLINLRYPLIFGVHSEHTVYYREFLLPVVTLVSAYSFVVFLYGQVRRNYDLDKYDMSYLSIVYSLMFFGTAVQMLFPSIMILWCCVSLATLMYYMFIQDLDFRTDVVTGMKNRNVFKLRMHQVEKERNIILVSFDLNDLKKVNDKLGHAVGDEYLRASAKTIQKQLKPFGRLYRIGGDEFCLLSINSNKYFLQKKLDELVKRSKCDSEYGEYGFSMAFGAAERRPGEELLECLKRADKRMYDNKAWQKSQICMNYTNAV